MNCEKGERKGDQSKCFCSEETILPVIQHDAQQWENSCQFPGHRRLASSVSNKPPANGKQESRRRRTLKN